MNLLPEDLESILKARADLYAQRVSHADRSTDDQLQVVIFAVGQQRIGIESKYIRSVIPIRSLFKVPKAYPNLIGVLHAESQLVSIFDTAKLLQLSDPDDVRYSLAVVLKSETLEVALACTDVINLVNLPAHALMDQQTFLYEHQITVLYHPHTFLAQLDQGR